MAETTVDADRGLRNLFSPVSCGMLAELLRLADELDTAFPEIRQRIEADQDRLGLERKQARVEQYMWEQSRTPCLEGLGRYIPSVVEVRDLKRGRPRMPADVAFRFLLIENYFCSVYSQVSVERLWDSLTVYEYLWERGVKMPGLRTIGDNVNSISADTRRYILECQSQLAKHEELDDFLELYGDSTSVEANSRWPTDSGLIWHLVARAFEHSQQFGDFELENFKVHWMRQWIPRLKGLDFEINVAKNARERKKKYRQLLKVANKSLWHLGGEVKRVHLAYLERLQQIGPMLRGRLEHKWVRVVDDLLHACQVYRQCELRVFEGKSTKSSERILSLSDEAAAFISKGDRQPVIGYKPQLARSRSGLITALLVPEGNAADSSMLVPLVEEAKAITGVTPLLASFDDGYPSGLGLDALIATGVQIPSFSGSKGKKLLGEELWEATPFEYARRYRSAAESLMFCLKHCHEFGRLRRRGIEEVRQELLGKAITYNFCRIIELRRRKKNEDRSLPHVA